MLYVLPAKQNHNKAVSIPLLDLDRLRVFHDGQVEWHFCCFEIKEIMHQLRCIIFLGGQFFRMACFWCIMILCLVE